MVIWCYRHGKVVKYSRKMFSRLARGKNDVTHEHYRNSLKLVRPLMRKGEWWVWKEDYRRIAHFCHMPQSIFLNIDSSYRKIRFTWIYRPLDWRVQKNLKTFRFCLMLFLFFLSLGDGSGQHLSDQHTSVWSWQNIMSFKTLQALTLSTNDWLYGIATFKVNPVQTITSVIAFFVACCGWLSTNFYYFTVGFAHIRNICTETVSVGMKTFWDNTTEWIHLVISSLLSWGRWFL